MIRSHGEKYYNTLHSAGIPAILKAYNAPHGFINQYLSETKRALSELLLDKQFWGRDIQLVESKLTGINVA